MILAASRSRLGFGGLLRWFCRSCSCFFLRACWDYGGVAGYFGQTEGAGVEWLRCADRDCFKRTGKGSTAISVRACETLRGFGRGLCVGDGVASSVMISVVLVYSIDEFRISSQATRGYMLLLGRRVS